MENKTNKLYFLAMGCDYVAGEKHAEDMTGSDVGNYRIRTTFHDSENNVIFAEFSRGYEYDENLKIKNSIKLCINHLYNKTISDDENESHIDFRSDNYGNYTKKDILDYINKKFKTNYDELVVVSHLSQFDYNKTTGDDFVLDVKKLSKTLEIEKYFYDYEKEILKKQYPNHSIYWENDILKVLIHYNCYNDIVEIEDIYNYSFNYQKPSDEFLREKANNYYAKFKGC